MGCRAQLLKCARGLCLQARTRRNVLEEQIAKLRELRQAVIAKLGSRQVKDSLMELRKYRRPPRAAAQVCSLFWRAGMSLQLRGELA